MQPHVYEWAKRRGFFGRKKFPISHLLLDGGVLSVPPESSAEFITAYAIGVVKKGTLPCVVETKTPVFRMFYDLDISMSSAMASEIVRGRIPDPARAALEIIIRVTRGAFDASGPVIVCASNAVKTSGASLKLGMHLTFEDIFVTSSTAMSVRDMVLDQLTENPFENEWGTIVDAAVFKGSGMRLPWSAKKNETRTYVPIAEFSSVWTPIGDVSSSVSATREILMRVSLRSFCQPTASTVAIAADDDDIPTSATSLSHASIREYPDLVAAVQALIPPAYDDGRVTAVLRGDRAIIFRHSSRYCANVERRHNSSNTYFLLTRRGLQQCCYSRKDEDVGRKYCLCRDFRGDHIDVPKALTDDLFPEVPKPDEVPPMPSRSVVNVDAIACFSRPKLRIPPPPRPKKSRHRPLSILLGK